MKNRFEAQKKRVRPDVAIVIADSAGFSVAVAAAACFRNFSRQPPDVSRPVLQAHGAAAGEGVVGPVRRPEDGFAVRKIDWSRAAAAAVVSEAESSAIVTSDPVKLPPSFQRSTQRYPGKRGSVRQIALDSFRRNGRPAAARKKCDVYSVSSCKS